MALEVAREARAAPEKFPELARSRSEDTITGPSGGSLGGIVATELLRTPELLDALAAIRPGEVSDVIETFCGFHVVQRLPVPAEEKVSGQRIVIGHDGARWLHRFAARGSVPARSRVEALTLANTVFDQARARPGHFAELVREYSEHADATDDGDMGEWSTHEVSPMPRELETLAGLEEGGIAAPIEGLYGFEILRRVPQRPRPPFAMEAIQIFFDADVPDGQPMSSTAALNAMADVVHRLKAEPTAWQELQRVHCCEGTQSWTQGREPRALEVVLTELTPGEIADSPVQLHSSFVIPRALASVDVPLTPSMVAMLNELPGSSEPDIHFLWDRISSGARKQIMQATFQRFELGLRTSAEGLQKLRNIERSVGDTVGFAEIEARIERHFGSESRAHYHRLLLQQLEHVVLSADKPMLRPAR